MKKIISMGIASAVLALTAIAASADIKADSTEKAINGKTIKVEITTTADIADFGFTVAATGLEIASEADIVCSAEGTVLPVVKEDGTIKFGGFIAPGAFKAGSVLATITYTVTAETGAPVVVEVKPVEGYDDVTENFNATVVAEEEPGTSEPGTSEPGTSEPGTEEPGTDVPGTGVALAVVPAVLAGAAVVVAKKRK